VVKDDMQQVYPLLDWAEVIFLASPIFFYGVTAQAKALIDRSRRTGQDDSWKKHRKSGSFATGAGVTSLRLEPPEARTFSKALF